MFDPLKHKTMLTLCLSLAGLIVAFSPALATKTFEPVYNPSLELLKASESITINGRLDDLGWANAARVDNFVERSPGDMTRPAVYTETIITYDEDNLYVAFICHDEPNAIRATMCERDQFFGDDAVCLLIDTYGNASWAYEFFVNPYGVQKDYLWSAVAGEDRGFDLIWESAAVITDSGFQVEMAIPFASMRFPNKDVQSWKMDFWRNRPRESFNQYSWAAYDRNEQCWPCQWGTVDGISNVRPGKGMELLPAFVATQTGNLPADDASFENGDIMGDLSLNGKYSISSDIVAEAALNPDFSQIEGDAAQIDVNSTIALFYPERRPFFQEGSDIFRTLFNSFYTRTVNDPQLAAKVTGRLGRNTFGFFTAMDENSPYMIPLDQRSIVLNSDKSVTNALRGIKAIGDDSQIGFILTDRRQEGGGSGSIAALDGNIRLTRNYRIDGQYILSHVDEPDDHSHSTFFPGWINAGYEDSVAMILDGMEFDNGKHTVAFDGESYYGSAFITRLRRNARHLDFILDFNQVSPSYRTQTGYDPVSNYRNASVFSSYTFYSEKGLLERVTPQIYTSRRWNFDGDPLHKNVFLSMNNQLRFAQTFVGLGYGRIFERYRGIEFDNLWEANVNWNSRINSQLGFGIHYSQGRGIVRRLRDKGDEVDWNAFVDFKPIDRLLIEPNVTFAKSSDIESGDELYKQFILRTRFRFQASRALSLRLVVQYNDSREMVNYSTGETWHDRLWDIDPMITYRISSFSVFYIGSTSDYYKIAAGDIDGDGAPDSTRMKLNSRQFFMKLQYLFRT